MLQERHRGTRVDETETGLQVDQGVVTLTGTVGSFAKKTAASEAAHPVANLQAFRNGAPQKAVHT